MKLLLILLIVSCIIIFVESKSSNQFYKHHKNIEEQQDDSLILQYSVVVTTNDITKLNENEILGSFKLVKGIIQDKQGGPDIDNVIATVYYQPDPEVNGWVYLSINTFSVGGLYNDSIQSLSAGYAEGYLTQQHIQYAIYNQYLNYFNSLELPTKLVQWITENINWMTLEIEKNTVDSKHWRQTKITLDQINGMVFGYNQVVASTSSEPITIYDLFVVNMMGDLFDLMPALGLDTEEDYSYFYKNPNKIQDYFTRSQHCSALVKVTDDYSDLFSAHCSWNSYWTMLRIFKSYNFDFNKDYSGTVSNKVLFSSYPGMIMSLDDFYQLADTELVILETTNSLITNDLYQLIKPESLLYWVRIVAANRMSNDGKQWCETFSLYNSGTYNNMLIVIDYKKFIPYKELKDGALYILEQIPGYVEYGDQTNILRTGYFSSYNIPFYPKIYDLSGYSNYTADNYTTSTIQYMSHQTCPRANIFRRDANKVESVSDLQALMRQNYYKTDPLSFGSPLYAISARGDLQSIDPGAFGALDTKLTSYKHLKQGTVLSISGPSTYDNLPIFQWSTNPSYNTIPHQGVPDKWNFNWVQFSNNSFI